MRSQSLIELEKVTSYAGQSMSSRPYLSIEIVNMSDPSPPIPKNGLVAFYTLVQHTSEHWELLVELDINTRLSTLRFWLVFDSEFMSPPVKGCIRQQAAKVTHPALEYFP